MSRDSAAERTTVLFVDDDESVCRSMSRCLERTGVRVTVAYSAAQALEAIDKTRFDVVVTDHQMPGMTGAELVRVLLARNQAVASRIVVTSGDLQGTATDELIRTTGCRGLAKPYTPADLALAIKAAVGPNPKALTAA